jgi:iron complex outermembrane receptor protein
MVDDIPLLRGDAGRPDWALLPIDDLDQIELVKGASSVVYGSSAINGAVNVRTAWPKAEPSTKIVTFLGSYSKPERKYATPWTGMNPLVYGITMTHSQIFNNIDLAGGITYYNDQGYIGGTPENKVPDTIFNKGQFNNRIKFYFNARVRSKKIDGLTYGLSGNFMRQNYAETYFWYDADTNIYRSYPGSLSEFKIFTFYLDPFVKYFANNGDVHSFKNRVYYLNSVGLYDQTALNINVFNEYQYSHKFRKVNDLMFIAGVTNIFSYSYGKVFSGKLAADGTSTLGEIGTYNAENFAIYTQFEKKFFKRLSVLLGGRYEFYNVADFRESKPIFRAGINMQASKGSYIRLSVGQGYRVPSIGERYITTTSGNFGFYPNPDLVSETNISYEVGFKQLFRLGKFNGIVDIAGFYQHYENYVEFNFGYWGMNMQNAEKNAGFKFFNTGPARIYGIDFSAMGEGMIARNLNLSVMLGYTYSVPEALDPNYIFYIYPYENFHDTLTYLNTSSDTTGHILKYRVQSILKADFQLTWKKISTGFAGRYYGFMKNIDLFFYENLNSTTGVNDYREKHNTGNFVLDYRVSIAVRNFNFSLIINNFLNTEYSLRPVTIEAPRMSQFQVIYKIN